MPRSGAVRTCRTYSGKAEAAACTCGLAPVPRPEMPGLHHRDSAPRLPQAASTLRLLHTDCVGLCNRLTDPLVWLLQLVCNALTCCIFLIWMNKNKSFCLQQHWAGLFCAGLTLAMMKGSSAQPPQPSSSAPEEGPSLHCRGPGLSLTPVYSP